MPSSGSHQSQPRFPQAGRIDLWLSLASEEGQVKPAGDLDSRASARSNFTALPGRFFHVLFHEKCMTDVFL